MNADNNQALFKKTNQPFWLNQVFPNSLISLRESAFTSALLSVSSGTLLSIYFKRDVVIYLLNELEK